jgi:cell division protein ZapA (FtsZ GTPase activity inhibitor)
MNVHFTVRGKTFNVRTDDDGSLLTSVAQQLDEKITQQSQVARKLDEPSLVIISALDLLHELAIEKRDITEQVANLQKKLAVAIATVDSLMDIEPDPED